MILLNKGIYRYWVHIPKLLLNAETDFETYETTLEPQTP
jgi:hypothetical protein